MKADFMQAYNDTIADKNIKSEATKLLICSQFKTFILTMYGLQFDGIKKPEGERSREKILPKEEDFMDAIFK